MKDSWLEAPADGAEPRGGVPRRGVRVARTRRGIHSAGAHVHLWPIAHVHRLDGAEGCRAIIVRPLHVADDVDVARAAPVNGADRLREQQCGGLGAQRRIVAVPLEDVAAPRAEVLAPTHRK